MLMCIGNHPNPALPLKGKAFSASPQVGFIREYTYCMSIVSL